MEVLYIVLLTRTMRDLLRQKLFDALAAPVPRFTRRDVRLPQILHKAVAVIGMRRSGKTTRLWQVVADRIAAGVPREALLYFSFEDERLAGMGAADLHLIEEEYFRLHPGMRGRAVFLLDEIQTVPGWESFARRLLDARDVELFLSGSSARLLSREVATSMRGRALAAVVHPFSFREYLRHLGREPGKPFDRLPARERSGVEKDLRGYLTCGGFPETIGAGERERVELLRTYVDTALFRDVVERHAVSHPVALRWMVRHLLGNASGPFTVHKFHGDLHSQGIPVSKDTLHAYLSHLEDAFLIRTVSIETGSERKRMVNPRKVYPVDPGLIPVYDRTGRANLGHALETCVLIELERRGAEVSWVRTAEGHEVDFLARFPGGKEELIQVCADLDEPATKEREFRGLIEARKERPRAALTLVCMDSDAIPGVPRGIAVRPAAGWLSGAGAAHP
ncbi:MAG: ATP-binding protein [Planctomycetes bacterium]|nr:ATP-binding protein [Planctomycetota bacterium]